MFQLVSRLKRHYYQSNLKSITFILICVAGRRACAKVYRKILIDWLLTIDILIYIMIMLCKVRLLIIIIIIIIIMSLICLAH